MHVSALQRSAACDTRRVFGVEVGRRRGVAAIALAPTVEQGDIAHSIACGKEDSGGWRPDRRITSNGVGLTAGQRWRAATRSWSGRAGETATGRRRDGAALTWPAADRQLRVHLVARLSSMQAVVALGSGGYRRRWLAPAPPQHGRVAPDSGSCVRCLDLPGSRDVHGVRHGECGGWYSHARWAARSASALCRPAATYPRLDPRLAAFPGTPLPVGELARAPDRHARHRLVAQ